MSAAKSKMTTDGEGREWMRHVKNNNPARVSYPSTFTHDGGERVAFFDFDEVHLSIEYQDGRLKELEWPSNWPERVNSYFLRASGYRIER